MVEMISFEEADPLLDWIALTDALASGHDAAKAEIADVFLYQDENTLLNRSAWIKGMGVAVKCATIFPGNPSQGKGMIDGAVNLFSGDDGRLEAILDFHLVTKWKTSGDSLLGARKLARRDSQKILLVGAGNVGQALRHAYGSLFPDATFSIWNRSEAGAKRFHAANPDVAIAIDLESAVRSADIIASATMTTDPIIKGEWLQPGQHVDLIGAYRPDMREVDDTALSRARIFVDNMHTTADHIGELKIPIAEGKLSRDDIVADFYNLDAFERQSDDEITLFKNGGGAHLDLMTSRYILDVWKNI
ncbi:ornithine cyclodeaminase [Cognatiyoonia sediminum]|uniref:Ornithine cyclodeaminase n=1 Tax=Cognatiyoonia sediminum TaxID=1508389 RepID=A0A1M5PZ00_9RHOB|nr:ornithine cyclodeaminase [Cognatiyoonia sediminum]SHH07084.1 ornithine cyclodeaminase [Cognatiyoonia sediminum]